MAYQETKTTSYGGRIGKAFKGILAGFVMFIGGTVLLFWNEGNFVKSKRALNEAQGVTVVVESVASVDPALEGKLIHATARAETDDILSDVSFGVEVNAISLKRKVEYYQWQESSRTEKRDKLGGGEEEITTYTYSKGWSSRPVNSSEFRDPEYQNSNWTWLVFADEKSYAENVTFGAYKLPDFFIQSISGEERVDAAPAAEQISKWTTAIKLHPNAPATTTAEDAADVNLVHVDCNTVYFGAHTAAPAIGDLRVTFTKVLPKEVSLLGKVNGETFSKYIAKNGKSISRLESGAVSAEEMFAHAHNENKILTWILRLVGVVLVCGGLRAIFAIFEAIAKVVPFLGSIVGAGVGLVCVVAGVAWSVIWIAIAWLAYRPLIGIPLLVIAVGSLYWLKTKGKKEMPAVNAA